MGGSSTTSKGSINSDAWLTEENVPELDGCKRGGIHGAWLKNVYGHYGQTPLKQPTNTHLVSGWSFEHSTSKVWGLSIFVCSSFFHGYRSMAWCRHSLKTSKSRDIWASNQWKMRILTSKFYEVLMKNLLA
ncbi:hypothetical protein NE237_006512 [Protea cynaroides]|uniref:Uncharacterized protein n=1 Tax=Protea cynaroides TaxID=273540 RepID=A0A9Q0KMF2_9MAGN|nr:hypothetical protein NE237_006512 [Protea cynaroides]